MQRELWGTFQGQKVFLHTLKNGYGIEARFASYGATLTSLLVPQQDGSRSNVVLGYDRLSDYINGRGYLGATVGRYASRIANGRFILDGRSYQLPCNENKATLHGGIHGFDKKVWRTRMLPRSPGTEAIAFSYSVRMVKKDSREI